MFFAFSAFNEYLSADLASPSASHSNFFFFAFKSSSSSITDFLFVEKASFSFSYNMYFCLTGLGVEAENNISLVIFPFRKPFTALILSSICLKVTRKRSCKLSHRHLFVASETSLDCGLTMGKSQQTLDNNPQLFIALLGSHYFIKLLLNMLIFCLVIEGIQLFCVLGNIFIKEATNY